MAGSSDVTRLNKATVRENFRSARTALTSNEYVTISSQINERLISCRDWRKGEVVHVFWPIINRKEPDIRPFIQHLLDLRVKVLMPVMVSFSKEQSGETRLRQAELISFDARHQNKWGITEPDHDSFVSPEEVDIAIVPALGAGRDGYRIGYGMGYYDEFLHDVSAPTICPVFSVCLRDAVPHEIHDIAVAVLITEQEIIETGKT